MKITVTNSISLDGVMQAPGRPDEDSRDDFPFGGWAVAYNDPVMMAEMGKGMAGPGVLLLGRWTYESLGRAWRGRTDNPFTAVLDNTTKYVASRTLTEPLDWPNSVLLGGDAADAVAELKRQDGPDAGILGSHTLIQSLRERGLIDRYVLLIHPLVLGQGRRLFPSGPPDNLSLVDTVVTTTGVIIATYDATQQPRG